MKPILLFGAVLITIPVILTLAWTGALADEEAPADVGPSGPIILTPRIAGTWKIAFAGGGLLDVCTLVFEQAFTDISWTSADCDGNGSGTINLDGSFDTSGDMDGLPFLLLNGDLSQSENYITGQFTTVFGPASNNFYGIRVQPRWDVNEDGSVSLLDFLQVLSHFGEVP